MFTYENERWHALTGFASIVIGYSTDPYSWSDESGKHKRLKENVVLPCSMFSWISDWKVDYSTETDKDGWQYAFDFKSTFHANLIYLSDY